MKNSFLGWQMEGSDKVAVLEGVGSAVMSEKNGETQSLHTEAWVFLNENKKRVRQLSKSKISIKNKEGTSLLGDLSFDIVTEDIE